MSWVETDHFLNALGQASVYLASSEYLDKLGFEDDRNWYGWMCELFYVEAASYTVVSAEWEETVFLCQYEDRKVNNSTDYLIFMYIYVCFQLKNSIHYWRVTLFKHLQKSLNFS